MARSLLFGTSVSPGIAIGVLRFAHNVQTVEMRRISPREVEGEQEQLRAAVTNVRAALQEAMAKVPEDLSEYREVIAAQIELARDPKLVGSALSRIEKELVCAAWALDSTVEQLCSIFRNMDDPYLRDRAQDIRAVGLRLRECLAGSCALPAAAQRDSTARTIAIESVDISGRRPMKEIGVQRTERRRFNFPRAAGLIVSRVQTQKIVFSGGENINRRISRSVFTVPPEGKLLPLYGGVEEVSGDGLGVFKNARLRRAERNVFRAPFGGIGRVEKFLHGVLRRDRRERAAGGEVHPRGRAADERHKHEKADQKKR